MRHRRQSENQTVVRGERRSESDAKMDYLYISNDPAENADNFNPKWAFLREMTTDEERYNAIRKRWGNADIPDPKTNLTYRHPNSRTDSESKENCFDPSESLGTKCLPPAAAIGREKNRKPSRRRSRSCTRPYEQLISNIHKKYEVEYSTLMRKQRLELEEIQKIQNLQTYLCSSFHDNEMLERHLHMQQNEILHLLSNHYNQVLNVIDRKNENIDACKRYMEEVAVIFTFYQKINSDEVTLQMTDTQYEHSVETEKMYALYKKLYK